MGRGRVAGGWQLVASEDHARRLFPNLLRMHSAIREMVYVGGEQRAVLARWDGTHYEIEAIENGAEVVSMMRAGVCA